MTHDTTQIRPFSADPEFDYAIRTTLGAAVAGASDIGEVLAATGGVDKGDLEGWFLAWLDLAERVQATADAAASAGHRVSAASAYLRASTYFAKAVDAAGSLSDDARLDASFEQQIAAWEGFVAYADVHVERVDIPYEESSLPGYVFHTGSPTRRGTIVAVNGSDGSLSSVWVACIAPGLARGYDVVVFDGPGQQRQLFQRHTSFRPDWEHVLTPVYDFVAAREGTDPRRIAVYGISQGGFWVARAVSFEHRFAAAITDPGVVDVSTSWTTHLPKSLLKVLDAGDDAKFDREMGFGMRFSPDAARTWSSRARPYGTTGYAATIRAVRAYTVADVARGISTPLLILSPEHEQFWPGQAAQLAALTAGVSTLVRFAAADGADEHCQPLARSATAERMFDWLDSLWDEPDAAAQATAVLASSASS